MHNTSSEFYNYLVRLTVEHFDRQKPKPGERYNLHLSRKDAIEKLDAAFRLPTPYSIKPFSYIHEDAEEEFVSIVLSLKTCKILLVASSEKITEDYITLLRNLIAKQEGIFEGLSMLVLFGGNLDSLVGGSKPLDVHGTPFNLPDFVKRIKRDVKKSSSLKNYEKRILEIAVNRMGEDLGVESMSIFDYEFVIDAMARGRLEKNKDQDKSDYAHLGLFPHNELKSQAKVRTSVVEQNFDLFEKVKDAKIKGTVKEDLDRIFVDDDIRKLEDEDWFNLDFSKIKKWKDRKKDAEPPQFIEAIPTGENNVWVRPANSTPSGKRKQSILLFNASDRKPVQLSLKFDKRMLKRDITLKTIGEGSVTHEVQGKIVAITWYDVKQDDPFVFLKYDDKESGKSLDMQIAVLPFLPEVLKLYRRTFQVVHKGKKNKRGRLIIRNEGDLVLNPNEDDPREADLQQEDTLQWSPSEKQIFKVDYEDFEGESIDFKLEAENYSIAVELRTNKPKSEPIEGIALFNEKRVREKSYAMEVSADGEIALILDNESNYPKLNFRDMLLVEREMFRKTFHYWERGVGYAVNGIELDLPEAVSSSYKKYCERLGKVADPLVPSLVFLNEDLREAANRYVDSVITFMRSIPADASLSRHARNIQKLGVLKELHDREYICFSPVHPLVLAYQLELFDQAKTTSLKKPVLERLQLLNLTPYYRFGEGESLEANLYTPVDLRDVPEWTFFKRVRSVDQGLGRSYVSKIVSEKIEEFTDHFHFLFQVSQYAPLRINVLNMGDCKEVLQGIFNYYRKAIQRRKGKTVSFVPIEVSIYGSEQVVTSFEELTHYNSVEEIEEISDLALNLKSTGNYESEDILKLYRDKVHFYTRKAGKDYTYAHISFYNFSSSQVNYSFGKTNTVKSGIAMRGLIADVPNGYDQETYRSGFGSQGAEHSRSRLSELAGFYNALGAIGESADQFEPQRAVYSTIDLKVRDSLKGILDTSQWVTFVKPGVDLNFFKEDAETIIIHYSDQYDNTSGYDAITVTQKTKQYIFVIEQYFREKNQRLKSEDAKQIVDLFNALNGEWLLKLVSRAGQFPREKLSILGGIKVALALLDCPQFIWIPVSMEEIVRVSGSSGLKMDDGLFSRKGLGANGGPLSDDLLMIGFRKEGDQLHLHFYPIEIKTGEYKPSVYDKAKKQVTNLQELLSRFLAMQADPQNEIGFLAQLYRNFFAKLAITAAEKLHLYDAWPSRNDRWKEIFSDFRNSLLTNQFLVSQAHWDVIGRGAIIAFSKNIPIWELTKKDDILEFQLPEGNGIEYLITDLDKLVDNILIQENSLNRDLLLFHSSDVSHARTKPEETKSEENLDLEDLQDAGHEEQVPMRIHFGRNLGASGKVDWTPTTTSEVMHTNTGIIGTMGTGKTQFTKSLLYQIKTQSSQNVGGRPINFLVFDYKGDYTNNDFAKATNATTYDLYRLPFNPLALPVQDNPKPLLPLHIASSLTDTITTGFGLGPRQSTRLREAIMQAYGRKGINKTKSDTWHKAPPTIHDVCEILFEEENMQQDSLYAAMAQLYEFELFEPKGSNTKTLFEMLDGVSVINLNGHDESIQNLIVAITLDVFYAQMQMGGHSRIKGDFRELTRMILVDEADNFLGKDFKSIRKILKEGREFGVGTILSTQFLNHFSTSENSYSNYILTWIVHRVNEIKNREVEAIFNLTSKESVAQISTKIKGLEKHQSIVNLAGKGPFLIQDRAFWQIMEEQS